MSVDQAKRKRRAARRRIEIMAIGKQLFLSRPYAQVSMEAIAEAADLSKATLYKYFSSKVEVYSAIILADAQFLADQIHGAFDPERDVVTNLRRMAQAYMKFFFSHPEYFQKLSWFYFPGRDRHLSAALIREVSLRMESSRSAIEKCLRHAIKRGQLRAINVRSAAMIIYGQWLGLTYLAVARGPSIGKLPPDYERLADMACGMHVEGLVAHNPEAVS